MFKNYIQNIARKIFYKELNNLFPLIKKLNSGELTWLPPNTDYEEVRYLDEHFKNYLKGISYEEKIYTWEQDGVRFLEKHFPKYKAKKKSRKL